MLLWKQYSKICLKDVLQSGWKLNAVFIHSNCTYFTLKIKQVGIPLPDVTHVKWH